MEEKDLKKEIKKQQRLKDQEFITPKKQIKQEEVIPKEDLLEIISQKWKDEPYNTDIIEDYFSCILDVSKTDKMLARKHNENLMSGCSYYGLKSDKVALKKKLMQQYKMCLLQNARLGVFDSFMLYIENERPATSRFYQPRRKQLKPIVDSIQELLDDKLDELFISQPPRTGKSTLTQFLICFIMGLDSEKSNLYCSFSDVITKTFYQGIIEILQDKDTYKWSEVFPSLEIANTNSKDETLNIGRVKKYSSLTCRSLYGTLNGACDVSGILIADDLLSGIEEALSYDRLQKAWTLVDNNLLTRGKENTKVIWVGTRWSVNDPIGKRLELVKDSAFAKRRIKEVNVPALNENDESNFDYMYGVGFSTDTYKQRRTSFEQNGDIASWEAQYMGSPIERNGTMFVPEDLRYYNGVLPPTTPDKIFMALDPAFGGEDRTAAPICYMYGEDIFVVDVIFSDGDKNVTQPLIANKCVEYGVTHLRIECNNLVASYRDGLAQEIEKRGYKLYLESRPAANQYSKHDKIAMYSPDIKKRMLFLENGKRSAEYSKFMQQVYGYKIIGKTKHDDAPDSLTMAIEMVTEKTVKPSVEIFKRFF